MTAIDLKAQLKEALDKPKGKLEQLNKSGTPRSKNYGGKRPGAGGIKPTKEKTLEKRGIKQVVEDHINEEVTIQVRDRKTDQVITIKKPRSLSVLEQLYLLGMGQVEKGNTEALKAWLDRALGRPYTPAVVDEDGKPVHRLVVDF